MLFFVNAVKPQFTRRSAVHTIQDKVLDVVAMLGSFNGTKVTWESDLSKIYVLNKLRFVPDYELVWAGDEACYYKVYIKLKASDRGKHEFAGYTFMRVQNLFSALDCVDVVRLIYKNRSNTPRD